MKDCPELPDPGQITRASAAKTVIERGAIDRFRGTNRTRWREVRKVTFEAKAAKQIDFDLLSHHPAHTDRGMDWGSLVHLLLETAMRDPNADLTSLARSAVEDLELEPEKAAQATETVNQVKSSDLWKRARESAQCLVEVPFQILRPVPSDESSEVPILVRGVIDLAFREEGGWVLVDYKTDRVSEEGIETLKATYSTQLDAYEEAWKSITGERVLGKYLYLTYLDRLIELAPG